jgi:hypothetical protein
MADTPIPADIMEAARKTLREVSGAKAKRASAASVIARAILDDRAAQAERIRELEEALRKAMLWTDEENDVGPWREAARSALGGNNG